MTSAEMLEVHSSFVSDTAHTVSYILKFRAPGCMLRILAINSPHLSVITSFKKQDKDVEKFVEISS